jgi:predicted nuclease of predicted toxin-antitoxin system
VRFLIDRCAGRRLAEWLRQQGHDVVESRERSPDPGDRKLLEWAVEERRVLVTMDKDFGEFIFSGGASHCGLVRLPDVPAERRIALMERVLADYGLWFQKTIVYLDQPFVSNLWKSTEGLIKGDRVWAELYEVLRRAVQGGRVIARLAAC